MPNRAGPILTEEVSRFHDPGPKEASGHAEPLRFEARTMMPAQILILWLGFEIKHLLADYVLQPGWMLEGKSGLNRAGGYAHAGLHALLSIPVLLIAGIPLLTTGGLVVAEFVVHLLIDFGKARLSRNVKMDERPRLYWILHGADQALHRLTYLGMATIATIAMAGPA